MEGCRRSPEEDAPAEVALGVCAPPAPGGLRKSGASSSSSSSSIWVRGGGEDPAEPGRHCLGREARPFSRSLLGSNPAQPGDQSALRGRRGRSPGGCGKRRRESLSPPSSCLPGAPTLPGLHLSPPPLPRPPRVSGPANPAPRRPLRRPCSLPAPGPRRGPSGVPTSLLPRPRLLPRRAGPAPRLSPASRPQARPLLPAPPPLSSTFPLLPTLRPSNPGSGPARVSASSPASSDPTPVSPSPGRRRPWERGAGSEGGGAGDPGKLPGGGKKEGEGEDKAGGRAGVTEEGPLPLPSHSRSGWSSPRPGPALDRPPRGGRRGAQRGCCCTRALPGEPRPRRLDAGLGASEAEPKAQELALRQGIWDAGGERRLQLWVWVKAQEEEQETRGRERSSQGQTAELKIGEGVKAQSHPSATGVG